MPGEGELAALFARRMERGPLLPPTAAPPPKPKSELAALFARRMEGGPLLPPITAPPPSSKSELAAVLERRAAGGSIPAPSPVPPQAEGNAPGRIVSLSSPPAIPTRKTISTPPRTPVASPLPRESTRDTPVEEPVRIVSTAENEELRAKFDERNLEAGIPTPALLANVRNNLKKPGSATATSVKSSSLPAFSHHDENSPPCPVYQLVKRTSFPKAQVEGEQKSHKSHPHPTNSAASMIDVTVKEKAESPVSKPCSSSDVDMPLDEKAPSEPSDNNKTNSFARDRSNSDSQHSLSARRRRIVASRSSADSAASGTYTSDLNNSSIATSASDRREKMIAKVRASQSSVTDDCKNISNQSQQNDGADSPVDVFIVSPKRDEFEVLFAEHDFKETSFIGTFPNEANSWDSISKEIHILNDAQLNESNITAGSPGASTATLPTNNVEPRVKNTSSMRQPIHSATENGKINWTTPEKTRIQNASTPKIRGNGSHRRENYYNKEAGGSKKLQSFQLSQHHKSMPSFREQRGKETEDENLPGEQMSIPHNFAPPYQFRQSPSQLSQMSGITTPSCFPQESIYFAPSSAPSNLHMQLPMLFGSPIPESCSASSSFVDPGNNMGSGNIGGPGAGLSAFSSGMEVENRRLRELLGIMTQKLEEKDAIVSQLMKRIGDLEAMNSNTARPALVNCSLSMDQSPRLTSLSVSSDLLSPGARSAGNTSDPYTVKSLSTLVKSTSSVNSESACLAEPSLYYHSPQQPCDSFAQASPQQLANYGLQNSASKKSTPSPSIATTISTASITTAKSSESGTPIRSNIRSKAASGARRRSSLRRNGSGTSRLSDERKFVC
ncbi:hypothetical protein ACHAXA_009404 [Cyclostephanos tholiformis]|uniref:Uncharacterized protein n=1 Tax=Cyclostephanos tholiformis TaxID=382380 RepID=A0ABD3R9M4_9STRA